jgi:putative methyltransferase (TIGR04325 family)
MNNLLKFSFYISEIKSALNLLNRHSGSYSTWAEALNNSQSYQNEKIIDQIKSAALVAKTEKKYFRDGIVFENFQYSSELNNLISTAYIKNCVPFDVDRELKILDFGGGMGSQHLQFYQYLNNFGINFNYNWEVVEQDILANFGKKNLETKYLKFNTIKEFDFEKKSYDIVVLGAVLQYIENPFEILDKILEKSPSYIYIDRTPFWGGNTNEICLLKCNKFIPGSYPSWIFSLNNFSNYFKKKYSLKINFNSEEGNFFFSKIREGVYSGMIWEKK